MMRRVNIYSKTAAFFKNATFVYTTSSLISFFLLFIIAFIELNTLSFLTFASPKLLGVETDSAKIEKKLKNSQTLPLIEIREKGSNKVISYIAAAQSGQDNIYGSRVIPLMSAAVIVPEKNIGEGVITEGDSVIVTEIDSNGFKRVSPVLSGNMVQKYFNSREIRSYPKISLIKKDEYSIFRQSDFSQKLKKFDDVINKFRESRNKLSLSIENKKKAYADSQEEIIRLSKEKEREYSKCVNVGTYVNGRFIRQNTKDFCEDYVKSIAESLEAKKREATEIEVNLQKDVKRLEEYGHYIKYYTSSKVLTKEESGYITSEFGTFILPDEIRVIILSPESRQSVADFFEVIIHEYLHYATYDPTRPSLKSSFFEEGLTEYFARKIIKSNLGRDTNMGYPVNVKILDQISKRISDSDMADIYFTKDQEKLEKTLDRVYGNNFYNNYIVILETLQYSSDEQEILKMANEVMNKIGGQELKSEDVKTTYSST